MVLKTNNICPNSKKVHKFNPKSYPIKDQTVQSHLIANYIAPWLCWCCDKLKQKSNLYMQTGLIQMEVTIK